MIEADKELDDALQAARTLARDQRRRLVWNLYTAASYALDALFLAAFAALGTIPAVVAAGYAAGGAAIVAGTQLVTRLGWNLRARDPSLIGPLVILAVALHLAVVAAAPQIAFPFLANVFTVFAFAMLWLSVRDSLVIWTLGTAGLGALFAAVGERLAVPTASRAEIWLVWAFFALILGRFMILSINANALRVRLAESRGRLADTLEQVKALASHDELTRALNRRALMASLARERVRAERSGVPFAIGMMDLDHFKAVNDTYGHGAGDAVLREFANVVHATMRATDVFGRYGGEEFLIVLVGTELPAALEALERIRTAVQSHDWNAIAPGLTLTVSAGVAHFHKGQSVEQLLHDADQALYQAKGGGRNRVIASKS